MRKAVAMDVFAWRCCLIWMLTRHHLEGVLINALINLGRDDLDARELFADHVDAFWGSNQAQEDDLALVHTLGEDDL